MNTVSLPEGVEEASPEQAVRLEACRRRLLDCFQSYGYQLVAPPLVDFFDALTDDSDALVQQTLSITDPLTGAALGLRADITPQVARMDARHLPQDKVARLCYAGPVMRARPEILGGNRNPIQVGAELYGSDSEEADAEIVQLLCAGLQVAGCPSTCLDLGHAGVFRALARKAEWTAQQRDEVFDILQRKAVPDLEAWLESNSVEAEVAAALRALPEQLSGADEEVLDRAKEVLGCVQESVADALDSLRAVARRVRALYPEMRLHFDLGEASGFHYERGMVFAVYLEGQGQEIARGGRYGGRESRPATGFSMDLRTLVRCGSMETGAFRRIYVEPSEDSAQHAALEKLRQEGCAVIGALGADDSAQAHDCAEQLVLEDGTWVGRPVEA